MARKNLFVAEDFLISGEKKLNPIDVTVQSNSGIPFGLFLQDSGASFMYHSSLGGFFPLSHAMIPFLAAGLHYGIGGFEGMALRECRKGTGYDSPTDNVYRLMYSAETLGHANFAKLVENSLGGLLVSATPSTAGEVYSKGRAGDVPFWNFDAHMQSGRTLQSFQSASFGFRDFLSVAFDAFNKRGNIGTNTLAYDAETLTSIFNAIAFLNRLVSIDHFPENPTKVKGGYLRPCIYYGNTFEQDTMRHLKIPSIGRTMELGIMNLPWGNYLNEEDYKTGLTVLIAPYERIGEDMPNGKITGDYINPKLNIDAMRIIANAAKKILSTNTRSSESQSKLAILASLGEVLVKSRDGTFVEGSAENMFVIFKSDKAKSGFVAYTPPVSERPLPGTNRARATETMEGMGIPVHYQSFDFHTIKKFNNEGHLVGIIFTGTGADIIHVQSIVDLPGLKSLVEMTQFASEGVDTQPIRVRSLLGDMEHVWLNRGEKHPIIQKIFDTHRKRMVEDMFVPVYDIRFEKLAAAMGIDFSEVTRSTENRRLCERGYFQTPFKDEATTAEKYRKVAHLLSNAVNTQWARCGIPKKEIEKIRKGMRS